MAELPREVDIFRKYTKHNKLITYILASIIAIVVVVTFYFIIKVVWTYTVSFETFGGTIVPDAEYKFLQKVEEPEKVKKEGFYIEKWSTKKDLSDRFVFGTKLWRSMKLYVDWQPGYAVVLNFAENEENADLSTADLKLMYEQYVKPGSDWTLPAVYNLNENSAHYGERLVWYTDPNCTSAPIVDKTYTNLQENIPLYGKWFDIDENKFQVDENGELQRYLGYAKNVILPSNVLKIKDIEPTKFIPGTDQIHEQNAPNASAFRNVINTIEQIYLNKELVEIGSCAFRNCINLKNVEFLGDNVTRIGQYVFTATAIKKISLPMYLTTIEEYCFYGVKTLETVTLGENVQEIEASAFADCQNLENVILHSAPQIGVRAFAYCDGHMKFTINAEDLATCYFDINEQAIREDVLAKNPSATEKDISDAIAKKYRESNVFVGTASDIDSFRKYFKIYVPESMLDAYKDAYGWEMYSDRIFVLNS